MPACDWDIIECSECAALEGLEASLRLEVEDWAINRLWEWTKMRFGPCEVTYHSTDPECCGATLQTQLRLLACTSAEMVLPGPIAAVISAVIDGEVLGPEDFRVDNYNILVRTDGGVFQGAWEVTYARGEAVPPGGGLVAGILACEYAKYICGDNSCQLPKRVSSITRQGITMAMIDNFQSLDQGYTGIWVIDDWIAEQNKPTRPSSVTSPDVPRPRMTTWTYASS